MVMRLILCLVILPHVALSQRPSTNPGVHNEYPVAVSFFAPFFFPKVLQDEYRLKEYLCSDEFSSLRRSKGDLDAVDALFEKAMSLSWGNTYEALLLLFVCTMEHRTVGVNMPVVGPLLWFPLTSEFPDEFRRRVKALPSRLYSDTPRDAFGDRDKLQHFFGSAFLTYTFESEGVAERFGNFVEWGEDKFVVEGALDTRDIRANRQGQKFGTSLLNGEVVSPSAFFDVGTGASGVPEHCVPVCGFDSTALSMEER